MADNIQNEHKYTVCRAFGMHLQGTRATVMFCVKCDKVSMQDSCSNQDQLSCTVCTV